MTHDMDTDALFEKYTIAEIRDIEKKTKQDIEKKREELRQMVGERYRDLIEAADTITEMKNSAQNVMTSIARMQELCEDNQDEHPLKSDQKSRKTGDREFYSLVSQMKLLMDIPEQIWSAIEAGSLLQATRLFLLGRHAHSSLQMAPLHAARVHTHFPVLGRQWLAVSHFKQTILTISRNMLKNCTSSDQVTADCLCSMLLLEETTPRQVFNEYLLTRTHAVQHLCQQEGLSVKTQVSTVVQVVISTVHQICAVFYAGDSDVLDSKFACNLLMTTLSQVTESPQPVDGFFDDTSCVSNKYLPKSVTEPQPLLQHQALPIAVENINANCRQWVETCIADVSTSVRKLLTYVMTIRGLSAIRDDIWTLLKTDQKMESWHEVCQCVLSQKLSIWDDFFQKLFLDRTKVLLQSQIDDATSTCQDKVSQVLSDLADPNNKSLLAERDLSSYIWAESRHDLPSGWCTGGTSKGTSGALMMKAQAYTPAVQRLCLLLDTKMRLLLDDSSHYISAPGGESTHHAPDENSQSEICCEPFDRFSDQNEVEKFLETASTACVHKILDHLSQQLDTTNAAVKEDNSIVDATYVCRLLLLSRFSAALWHLCPNLQRCVEANSPEDRQLPKKGSRLPSKSEGSSAWINLKDALQRFSQRVTSVWSSYVCDKLMSEYTSLVVDTSNRATLLSTIRWDEVEITEETEAGDSIKSNIRIPLQPDWYLQSLLYKLCEHINSVGAHVINRQTLSDMVTHVSDGILGAYEKLMDGSRHNVPVTQNKALQMLFDLKFISSILPRRQHTETDECYQKRLTKLIGRVETLIDPFDLDVFAPYLQERVTRHIQRSCVLFGALHSRDSSLAIAAPRSTLPAGVQEQHNVLPIAANRGRFVQLPLSTAPRPTSSLPPVVQPPQSKIATLGPGSPPPSVHAADENTSFLGQMSTIWFSNVGSAKVK